jgi:hypothetical protein
VHLRRWDDDVAMLVMPLLKNARLEWRRLVIDQRMLMRSSPTGWVSGTLLAWWLDQFRLGERVTVRMRPIVARR